MAVSDAGQGALGDWRYKVTARLRQTGGVDMTVTNIQVLALFGPHIVATASVIPALSVSANSSSDPGVVFAADIHAGDLSALAVDMTVEFRDANGNTGSVSSSFPASATGTAPCPYNPRRPDELAFPPPDAGIVALEREVVGFQADMALESGIEQ